MLEELHVASLGDSYANQDWESDDEELPIKGSSLSIEVNLNNVDLAARRLTRALAMEGLEESMTERRWYIKPAVKRVMTMEDRGRRHVKRRLKRKIKWFLDRRDRGY